MSSKALTEQDWQIRLYVYRFFVDQERPPTFTETADKFDIPAETARESYHRLNEGHALFLTPDTNDILMAHPLSAIATNYRVHINGRSLWANCAWDSLGIAAMLHHDAQIEALIGPTGERVTYAIEHGELKTEPKLANALVHFALPFSRWYDDLVDT